MLQETVHPLVSMVSTLFMLLGRTLPVSRARRGISTIITIVLILVIIIGGVAIIAVLIFFPGATTTTTYP